MVNGKVVSKPSLLVGWDVKIELTAKRQYVSRAALKLASVARVLNLDFTGKVVLDIGSSTGGFTDYALKHGASKVIAVDVGTNQLHSSLRTDERVELHEQTDIRDYVIGPSYHIQTAHIDIVLIDVSFISLQDILPAVKRLVNNQTMIVAMVKPQFEAYKADFKHKGVIKNEKMRRNTLKDFETWVQKLFKVLDKADSEVAGARGNQERFYLLRKLTTTN